MARSVWARFFSCCDGSKGRKCRRFLDLNDHLVLLACDSLEKRDKEEPRTVEIRFVRRK